MDAAEDDRDRAWLVVTHRGTERLVRADGTLGRVRRATEHILAFTTDGAYAVVLDEEGGHSVLFPDDRRFPLPAAEGATFAGVGPRRLARASAAGLHRIEIRDSGPELVEVDPTPATGVHGARDGRTVALARAGEVWVVDLESGDGRAFGAGASQAIDDEARLVIVERGDRLFVVDADREWEISPVGAVTKSAKGWEGARASWPRFTPARHVVATLKRDDGARTAARWVPRSKRWSALAEGQLCDVHPSGGWLALTSEGRVRVTAPDGRRAAEVGEGSFARWLRPEEPRRELPPGPTEAPTVQVFVPEVRRPAPPTDPAPPPAPTDPAPAPVPDPAPEAKRPRRKPRRPPRPPAGPFLRLVSRTTDEPPWPDPPAGVADEPATDEAVAHLRARAEALIGELRELEAAGVPRAPLRTRITALKAELLATPQRVLGAAARTREGAAATIAAQVLILRYGHRAARWVLEHGPIEPAIEWALFEKADWLPPLADGLARRAPAFVRGLWPFLTKDDAAAALLVKRLDSPAPDAAEREWLWDRYFEVRPREAFLSAQRRKERGGWLLEAQRRVLAGDASDPVHLRAVACSNVPELRDEAYALLHGLDRASAWRLARRTLRSSDPRWRRSATGWARTRPEVDAARYFFEAIALAPYTFLEPFLAWRERSTGALPAIAEELGDDERAALDVAGADEAAFRAWLASGPTSSTERTLPLLVAFAHPDEALAGRLAAAIEAPAAWMLEPLLRAGKRLPIDEVARFLRAHPDEARRRLDAAPGATRSEQVRVLKLLFLLGDEHAAEAQLRARVHSDPYVRSLLAGFMAERT